MFGNRRRRAASNPPLNGSNANANATSAAAQAFLKDRSSNASLAAAAAGAALRSRPTSPTSVADVQTKRTIRRASSISSVASSAVSGTRGPPGAQLERRGSSSSMTERTFRAPSPAPSQAVPSALDAPPVPLIPQSLRKTQVGPSNSHRRAASLEAPAMRVASPPPKAGGRGSSLGPAAYQPPWTGGRTSTLTSVQELTSLDRPASRGSVNFSYPTSSRPEAPEIQKRRLTSPFPSRTNPARIVSPTNQNLIYDPNTRSFLPEAEILAIEQRLNDAVNKPVKKKKGVAPQQAAGTHLAGGGMGGKPKGTALDEMEAANHQAPPVELAAHVPAQTSQWESIPVAAPALEPPSPAPPARNKKKKVVVAESESDEWSYQPNSSDTDSDFSAQPAAFNTRAGAMLQKRPSIVREDREREEEEDDTPVKANVQDGLVPKFESGTEARPISHSLLPHSMAGRSHGRGQASASTDSSAISVEGVGMKKNNSARGGRIQSVSPARTAHFATTPENLGIKHQPPARAISPRKSAMKHTNSPRGPSPVPGHAPETSEAFSTDELFVPKKKANRVSFDDTNVVVGTAAAPVSTDSPLVASTQSKRTWLPFGRGKKKEISSVVDDEDEVMKPRPALPSFGSIREKKAPREFEPERPLVKPAETVEYQPLESVSPPIFTSPTGEVIDNLLGQSSDHGAGAILAQDAASKNAANISKSREPLPPQVLSVEGSGYNSESDSSVDDLENGNTNGVSHVANGKSSHEPVPAEQHRDAVEEDSEDNIPTPTGDVPAINVLQATPTMEETAATSEWPDMPGSWRNSNASSSSESGREDNKAAIVEHHVTEPTISDLGISEPDPVAHPSPPVGEIASQNSISNAIMEEPEPESEADSIYSDAAEDLSEAEGDGFMSLDAVVESPVSKSAVHGLAISTPPDSPTAMSTKERAYKQSKLSRADSEPEVDDGWEKVQSYWKTLSTDKKKQLEKEAREAAEGSDTEIEAKPKPKPKKKKKVIVQDGPVAVLQQREAPANDRQYSFQPGSKAGPHGHPPASSMRSSMRAEPPSTNGDAHIRKSMRGATSTRGSLRGSSESAPEPRGSLQKRFRPLSYPANGVHADPAAVQMYAKALSAASAKVAPAAAACDENPPPTLRRRGSGDSQSSFKRTRPKSAAPNLRMSMRGSQDTEPQQSSRFSIRSLSPTGSAFRRPFSSASNSSAQAPLAPTHMRNSMRSNVGPTPTMRAPAASSGGFFGRSSSSKPAKKKPATKPSSRFADSSDEEDARPAFRSRFVDSSDEDEPTPARTKQLRLPPRRAGVEDGDSSDLPDSDDTAPSPAKKPNSTAAISQGTTLASGSLRRSGSGRGPLASPGLISPTPRSPTQRRGSFMSILRRKKDTVSKVRKSDAESPARRDTPLERSKSDLQILKAAGEAGRSPTPKLVKRSTGGSFGMGSRSNSGVIPTISRQDSSTKDASWPLPAPHLIPFSGEGEGGRPNTADGEPASLGERPDIEARRLTATGLSGVDVGLGVDTIVTPGGVDGEEGVRRKKKKFGKLRRIFGLDD